MRIGRASFDVKGWSWTKFRKAFESNPAALHELNRYGYTLESAYTYLTGKEIPQETPKKNVRKDSSESKGD